ncbi:DNA polymerase III subunit psi [Psychrobacter sp. Ps2]|uniref:DNA polymerase III subunit psi n=1 Tax=Psychrobacter sp. Ps2 TaxID=2790956 RepID=UPI001EE03F4B|nr:DNA polymerase III subunit psi [Psychrobacter sp. Ps2]MCG3859466.1 DNA polymerase III subunit psi [Psychrobacter sp. Ps2]
MSDIQDPLTVLQRRVQQRQILAMIGINQWVQPESETINMADIATASVEQSNIVSTDIESSNNEVVSVGILGTVDRSTDGYDINDYNAKGYVADEYDPDLQATAEQTASEQSPVIYSFDSVDSTTVSSSTGSIYHDIPSTTSNQTAVTSTNAPIEQPQFAQNNFPQSSFPQSASDDSINDDSLKKVAPFDLQGGRYNDWVIVVDIKALDSDSQKLWQNITQALSITCETTSFPICDGMDTAELANASLAGYIFRIGRSEDIQVAALTALPDGLQHPNLTTVPTLEAMLADSDAKRQLWEQISH